MGKYDEQTNELYLTLQNAGFPTEIDRDADEHLVFVLLPGEGDRRLEFDPTDDGSWRLDLVIVDGDLELFTNVVQGVGVDFAAPIVKGLLAEMAGA